MSSLKQVNKCLKEAILLCNNGMSEFEAMLKVIDKYNLTMNKGIVKRKFRNLYKRK